MIKTYLKHFVLDRFINSIFDGLMNTFDVMPILVVGRKYRMVEMKHTHIINSKYITPTSSLVDEYRFVVENAMCIDQYDDCFVFKGGTSTVYVNNIQTAFNDYDDHTVTFDINEITMVFE